MFGLAFFAEGVFVFVILGVGQFVYSITDSLNYFLIVTVNAVLVRILVILWD